MATPVPTDRSVAKALVRDARLAEQRRLPERPPRTPSTAYSRLVTLLKFVLPVVAVGLLLLVAIWPRLEASLVTIKLGLPRLDLSEARDLRMVNARYSGIDKQGRPFLVTADVTRQTPNKDDLVSLEGPKADITLQSGAWVVINSDTGIYQQQAQQLDMFGRVKVFHDRGIEFTTDSARVNLSSGTAEGDEHVDGQGYFGEVTSDGFRMSDKGAVIIFTGRAKMLIVPRATPVDP